MQDDSTQDTTVTTLKHSRIEHTPTIKAQHATTPHVNQSPYSQGNCIIDGGV
jgi:hypothetical protein